MNDQIPRLRMFAGPNGSGKTTIKSLINPDLIQTYINPDEIEEKIYTQDFLDLKAYGIHTSEKEILDFFTHSSLMEKAGLTNAAHNLRFSHDKLLFHDVPVNAYFASVIADFIRNKLLESRKSFTFETVMSSSDKIELLKRAQKMGYRTYLYYIATENSDINIARVLHRVKMGGHSVPKDKIISRYQRSLDLLMDAIQLSHRAYIFDNSSHQQVWLAEITNGQSLELKTREIPNWFKKMVLEKFVPTTN